MSDLTRYRIEAPIPEGKSYTADEAWMVDFDEGFAIVPDSTLQDIADAWNDAKRSIHTISCTPPVKDLLNLLDALVANES